MLVTDIPPEAEIEMAWDDSALNITVNPMEQDSEKLSLEGGSGNGSVSSSLSSRKLLARSSLSCDKNGARVTSMLETQPGFGHISKFFSAYCSYVPGRLLISKSRL